MGERGGGQGGAGGGWTGCFSCFFLNHKKKNRLKLVKSHQVKKIQQQTKRICGSRRPRRSSTVPGVTAAYRSRRRRRRRRRTDGLCCPSVSYCGFKVRSRRVRARQGGGGEGNVTRLRLLRSPAPPPLRAGLRPLYPWTLVTVRVRPCPRSPLFSSHLVLAQSTGSWLPTSGC